MGWKTGYFETETSYLASFVSVFIRRLGVSPAATTDAICLEALLLAFRCDWLAHSGENLAQFAPAVLKSSLCLIIFLR